MSIVDETAVIMWQLGGTNDVNKALGDKLSKTGDGYAVSDDQR